MWKLSQIPKIAHFYWANSCLPWIRYLSLETFRRHNPDWEIVLYRPSVLTLDERTSQQRPLSSGQYLEGRIEDWWSEVEKLGVKIVVIDIQKELSINLSYLPVPDLIDVHSYDYLHTYLLIKYGGLHVNMDMLFYKSMEQGLFNISENADYDVIGLAGDFDNFMMAKPHSEVMENFLKDKLKVKKIDIIKNYSAIGPEVWGRVDSPKVLRISPDTTEPYVFETDYYRKGDMFALSVETVAVHWHGSGTHTTYADLTLENYKSKTSLIAKLVQLALERG